MRSSSTTSISYQAPLRVPNSPENRSEYWRKLASKLSGSGISQQVFKIAVPESLSSSLRPFRSYSLVSNRQEIIIIMYRAALCPWQRGHPVTT